MNTGSTTRINFAVHSRVRTNDTEVRIVDIDRSPHRIFSGHGGDLRSAFEAALRELQLELGLGEGVLAWRVDAPYAGLQVDVPNPMRLRMTAAAQLADAASDAANVLNIAALVAAIPTGGGSLVLLAPASLLGAAGSGYRVVHRAVRGELTLDAEAWGDLLTIAGAVVGGAVGATERVAAATERVAAAGVADAARLARLGMIISGGKVALRLIEGGGYVVMAVQTWNVLARADDTPAGRQAALEGLLNALVAVGIGVAGHARYARTSAGPHEPGTPFAGRPFTAAELGLTEAQFERVRRAEVTPAQAEALKELLGTNGMREMAKTIARVKRMLEVEQRLRPLRGHPALEQALARLTARGRFNRFNAIDLLGQVAAANLPDVLAIAVDPGMPNLAEISAMVRERLLASPAEQRFILTYGAAAWRALQRGSAGENVAIFRELLARIDGIPREDAEALVEDVIAARTRARQREALGLPRPPRRPRPSARVEANTADRLWPTYETMATEFAREHPKWLADAERGTEHAARTREDILRGLATLFQVRENAKRGLYEGYQYATKVALLDRFDTAGRLAGVLTVWINSWRGSLSEALFLRGRSKPRLYDPVAGELHIPDAAFEAGERPGTRLGIRECVEHKSDLITGPADGTRPYGPAVAAAEEYLAVARKRWPAVRAAGGVMVIEFVRLPGNEPTRAAMLRILFREPDLFRAVRFGDGPWIERDAWLATRTGGR